MPWSLSDAGRFTKRARTKAQKKKWAKIANSVLAREHDEGLAIRIANAAMKVRRKRRRRAGR